MGAGFSSLYQEIHYFEVCYIEVWVYHGNEMDAFPSHIVTWQFVAT